MAFVVGGRLIQYLESIPPVDLPLFGPTESWRMTFFIVGLPGLILALLIRWLISEPERGVQEKAARLYSGDASALPEEPAPSYAAFFGFVRSKWKPYLSHNLGFGLHMMFSFALTAWIPAVLLRTHGWSVGDVGLFVGGQYLIIGGAGVLLGGRLARWWREHGESASEVTIGAISCAALLFSVMVLVAFPTPMVTLIVSGVTIFFKALPSGLSAAALQIVSPARYRGQSGALFLLIGSLLGLALGPLLVALITDYVFADKNMVDQSLLAVGSIIMPIGIVMLLWGRKYFRIDPAGKEFTKAATV